MHPDNRYKFKLINGILSWKNNEMERYMPVSPEILTRVILLYEKELKSGMNIWKKIEELKTAGKTNLTEDPLFQELATWMDQLQGIFQDIEPFREKKKWMDGPVHLN